ncbi:Oidioi.mRNA.OKI2018_I69.chr2.g6391.t3.cds [Oikopleura dioica]|uniref:Cap-specific mRNA (nucleoside-2'-O-)-methyltransferase 2 n=1 Tax=Oikopleura dioica TaxID=34765 RepID=A0ABN7T2U2_OIKDI|nr:Oidioi.mRNA.OKI2018_I69.chr2.g6391.t3.cds [Oikopleura dioica]
MELEEILLERSTLKRKRVIANELDNDFTNTPERLAELYGQYAKLRAELLEQQRQLSGLEITKWHETTTQLHPASEVLKDLREDKTIKAPLLTQAWLKFYEILWNVPELIADSPNVGKGGFNSLHLCEAPGAFISALLQYWASEYRRYNYFPDWRAATLNPHHEESDPGAVIRVDTLILEFPHRWVFGTDNTGNIFNFGSLANLKGKQFSLVTGDGGVDCSADPEFQEENSAELKTSEYKAICYKLKNKGNAVLKLFCCCHESSLKILESAASSFQIVELVKPASSKAGNSELYLIMRGYFGRMAPLENSAGFLEANLDVIRFFINRQRKAIADNLEFEKCNKDWNIDMSQFVLSNKQILSNKMNLANLKGTSANSGLTLRVAVGYTTHAGIRKNADILSDFFPFHQRNNTPTFEKKN